MSSRIRGRITSAHVIAVIALVLALTGTSVAFSAKNSVTSRDIKNGTIVGADVHKNALNGRQINERKLGEVPEATEARNVLWAAVTNPNGPGNVSILRAGQQNTAVGEGNNEVVVGFGRDVSVCSWTATAQGSGFAQTSPTPNAPNGVTVRVRKANGTLVNGGFNLQVDC